LSLGADLEVSTAGRMALQVIDKASDAKRSRLFTDDVDDAL